MGTEGGITVVGGPNLNICPLVKFKLLPQDLIVHLRLQLNPLTITTLIFTPHFFSLETLHTHTHALLLLCIGLKQHLLSGKRER